MLLETKVCDFGWKAPNFTLKDPSGQEFTMTDHLGEKGLLIAFICNHCPYVKAITKRLKEDTDKLMAEGINVIAIMANDYEKYPDDAPEKMKQFKAEHDFNFPYLVDEDQAVARAYDAICTPDFFGFNSKGELQYRGRLDDKRMEENAEGRDPELLNAMLEIAKTGLGPKEQSPSMGCSLKWRE
jgi:peroxiredoxin